jgi:hypothetical protein
MLLRPIPFWIAGYVLLNSHVFHFDSPVLDVVIGLGVPFVIVGYLIFAYFNLKVTNRKFLGSLILLLALLMLATLILFMFEIV